MKVVILGGLGYIGSSLCQRYAERTDCEVWVVDRKMIGERVADFPTHFRFIQSDIADLDRMKSVLDQADLLYFLAAEVEAENSKDKSDKVWWENFELPKSVMELCGSGTRILFPSSGNVFGGVSPDGKYLGLTEEDEPCPKLPYAESKRAIETFLIGSQLNFVVVRFGTNFGYAPGVRFNLVTNIFTLRALQGQNITVHGTGENYRPTVSVNDCSKALDFLSLRSDAQGEIFHVVSESYQIRTLAEKVIAATGSSSKLTFIDKVVPFNAYGLTADKLKGLGFTFDWPLERAIACMAKQLSAVHRGAAIG